MTRPNLAKRSYRRVGGVALPKEVDWRQPAAKRYEGLVRSYAERLGEARTAGDVELVKRCATLASVLAQNEIDVAMGRRIDGDLFIRLHSELRRNVEMLERRAAEIAEAERLRERRERLGL